MGAEPPIPSQVHRHGRRPAQRPSGLLLLPHRLAAGQAASGGDPAGQNDRLQRSIGRPHRLLSTKVYLKWIFKIFTFIHHYCLSVIDFIGHWLLSWATGFPCLSLGTFGANQSSAPFSWPSWGTSCPSTALFWLTAWPTCGEIIPMTSNNKYIKRYNSI